MPSTFIDRSVEPTSEMLSETLESMRPLWDATLERLAGRLTAATSDWAWSGSRSGWLLRVAQKRKPLVFLIPDRGAFRVSLAIPERVHATPLWSTLPDEIRTMIDSAPLYPEGRAVRLDMRCSEDLTVVEALLRAKLAV